MDSKRELTPNEIELRNKWQEKHRRLNTDSPDSDFVGLVRKHLIKQNMFQSLTDGTREETAQERRTPLPPTDTDSERSMMTPSPLFK